MKVLKLIKGSNYSLNTSYSDNTSCHLWTACLTIQLIDTLF